MSTNHRPQLESKRGKVIKIKDTIQHARGLPQQTSIKYRQDIKNEKRLAGLMICRNMIIIRLLVLKV